jgi:hypothetical protein
MFKIARFAALVVLSMLLLSAACERASAQSRGYHFFSAATTNSTFVRGAEARMYTIVAVNTAAAVYYLKLYDKSSAPTCGTDVPVFTVPISFATAGIPTVVTIPGDGLFFQQGVGFCLTAAAADADTGAAATGVTISFAIK